MKKLFSFIMVGLAFTVLQVSISQAQVTAPGIDPEAEKAVETYDSAAEKYEDNGGQGVIWNKMTHGAKQGRKVAGTKTSGNYADEESKAGDHQYGQDMRIKTEKKEKKEAREADYKVCMKRQLAFSYMDKKGAHSLCGSILSR